ncbi:MAG: hypothetical protein ACE5KL_05935 [Alphaproteobacteria bacterium]
MSPHLDSDGTAERPGGHPTTRRGFISGVSFGVVSLYGLWAAYGAAPTSLAFLSGAQDGGMAGMGHGGHAGGGMSPEEFERLAREFFEANTLPDGSVKPDGRAVARTSAEGHEDHAAAPKTSMAEGHGHEEGPKAPVAEGHGHEEAPKTAVAEGHGHEEVPKTAVAEGHGHEEGPIDVYVMASRYGYQPEVLRLAPNVPYKFRFMATDADHGHSINMRLGSLMIRCRARTLTETTLLFTAPGEYLSYCTVYCGEGHDMMMGKILVA